MIVESTLSAGGNCVARGEVVAVQVPEHLITAITELDKPSSAMSHKKTSGEDLIQNHGQKGADNR